MPARDLASGIGRAAPARRPPLLALALALLAGSLACSEQTAAPAAPLPRGEWVHFEGSLSASGTRQTLALQGEHRASISSLSGTLLLTGRRSLGVGFHVEFLGFGDSTAGLTGRCVWTDERGDKVFSELTGGIVATGQRVEGRLLGGTGRYAGVAGTYAFDWQYVIASDGGEVNGRSVGLAGRACIGCPEDGPPQPAGSEPQR